MATSSVIPELHEGRDGRREVFKAINALIRRTANQAISPGGAKLAYDLGNNILGVGGSTETVVWQRPIPYAIFGTTITIYLATDGARSAAGTATFALRVSSTPNTVGTAGGAIAGSVIASGTVPTAGYPAYTTFSLGPIAITGLTTGDGYLALTVTPGAGTAQIKEGGVTLS